MHFSFPYAIDPRLGRSAQPDDDAHVRQLIEQVLLTAPGERVHRPNFGSGLRQLLFAPESPEVAAVVQSLVQSALQQWLRDHITLEGVRVDAEDALLRVTVQYRTITDPRPRVEEFIYRP